jgi:predicted Zn-ribbon and HTH transcriptional regulator
MAKTRRQQLLEILTERSWTVEQLVLPFEVSNKDILDDMEHLLSLPATRRRLIIEPAQDRQCNFRSNRRDRHSKPSRFPGGRNAWLTPPTFHLKERP